MPDSATSRRLAPSTSEHLTLEVSHEDAGHRVDQFLVSHLAHATRSQIQKLIKDGRVTIDNKLVRASATVHTDNVVTIEFPPAVPAKPKAEPLPINIVHEDSDVIVVNKPAGMVVHPAAGHPDGTLVNALIHHVRDLSGIGGELRPGIVHRLDRGTSGLIAIAKHDQAHADLAKQFKDRKVEKEYTVLVWGVVQQGRRIDLPIGRDPLDRKKISTRSRRAREAVTRVVGAEHLDGVSFLKVTIATGRTHQIRVHLSAIGHPIVGDPTYGGKKRHPPAHLRLLQRLDRPFLHASRLVFTHPNDGTPVDLSCEIPEDLQAVISEIRTITADRKNQRQ